MKPLLPHDPQDDLIAAALHDDLTPEERTQFESRLQTDSAAQATYQEAQAMHDLLEKTHTSAQPDSAFEQRMVSGVRRKLQSEQHRETAWESLLALWHGVKGFFVAKRKPVAPVWQYVIVLFIIIPILAGVALGPITSGIKQAKQSADMQMGYTIAKAEYQAQVDANIPNPVMKGVKSLPDGRIVETSGNDAKDDVDITDRVQEFAKTGVIPVDQNEAARQGTLSGANTYAGGTTVTGGTMTVDADSAPVAAAPPMNVPADAPVAAPSSIAQTTPTTATDVAATTPPASSTEALNFNVQAIKRAPDMVYSNKSRNDLAILEEAKQTQLPTQQDGAKSKSLNGQLEAADSLTFAQAKAELPAPSATPASTSTPAAIDTRKLIRNAQLDLEVKSFQAAMDQITALTKAAGGYVDTSNSQKGGNGKLQGTVVVKVLPQNLDDFLLKLRDLGQAQNQSVSTDDVTKDYYDTQARLDNSRRMEEQLQDLLKHANSKVADLLQVERELGRVRGDIEQMQGQLKLYDFQVQYATVTIQMREKDLNQTAAYLLKEQDDFSLFATDVEGTFQKARAAADDFKAQVLVANLVHNSGSDVAAELTVMVAPDQIEPFLGQIRSLGRVANFTRQTQRVANDGGDSNAPADQALTEKDKVQVHLAIRSDDETRKQVALTVVAKAVDDALDQAKTSALANAGVEILSSSLNKTPQGQSTAQLTLRVPGQDYATLIGAFKALGRTASLSIQRNDNSGPGANGDDAPVIVSLALTDDDTPLQETAMLVLASDVDSEAQQIKKDAAAAGVEVKASSFERQPDGTELAQMTFRLPMAKYTAFVESVKALGKVESLSVRRDDRPDQTVSDDTAPVEIGLQLHNQRDIVADNSGLWATLRQTFGDGAGALFGSVRVIGVVIAFLIPWVFTLVLLAWVGRRIYIWRKK